MPSSAKRKKRANGVPEKPCVIYCGLFFLVFPVTLANNVPEKVSFINKYTVFGARFGARFGRRFGRLFGMWCAFVACRNAILL